MSITLALNLIDIIAQGVKLAPVALEAYNQSRAKVQEIVNEGREPTVEEHEHLNALLNSLRNELHKPI